MIVFSRRVVLWAGIASTAPLRALAQTNYDPFKGATEIVKWFTELDATWQTFVTIETRAQLVRSVDKLRRSLYVLEFDSTDLRDRLPAAPPKRDQIEELHNLVSALLSRFRVIRDEVREIGADVRLEDRAQQVEELLVQSISAKGEALWTVDAAISAQVMGPSGWDRPRLVAYLNRGIEAVHDAQLAVTSFQRLLDPASVGP